MLHPLSFPIHDRRNLNPIFESSMAISGAEGRAILSVLPIHVCSHLLPVADPDRNRCDRPCRPPSRNSRRTLIRPCFEPAAAGFVWWSGMRVLPAFIAAQPDRLRQVTAKRPTADPPERDDGKGGPHICGGPMARLASPRAPGVDGAARGPC